jgi:hypothetical protein
VGYTSRYYRTPSGFDAGWKLLVVRNLSPSTRGGGIYSVEGGRWIVTLGGYGADYPSQDDDGFLAFAASLGVPDLVDALRAAEPLGSIVGYRRTVNVLHRLDRMSRWPRGLVALGDAVCGFNPIYAQGMSVAALGAQLLGETWDAHGAAGDVEWRFQRGLARLLRGPWDLAVHEDYRFPGTEGPRPARTAAFRAWYEDQVLRTVVSDRVVHRTFVEVLHMLRPSSDLARPGTVVRVARARLRAGRVAAGPRDRPGGVGVVR